MSKHLLIENPDGKERQWVRSAGQDPPAGYEKWKVVGTASRAPKECEHWDDEQGKLVLDKVAKQRRERNAKWSREDVLDRLELLEQQVADLTTRLDAQGVAAPGN